MPFGSGVKYVPAFVQQVDKLKKTYGDWCSDGKFRYNVPTTCVVELRRLVNINIDDD